MRFYTLLAGRSGGELTFQTFPDAAEARRDEAQRRSLTRILCGVPDDLFPTLRALNDAGAGIFVAVNAMSGGHRSNAHVSGIQAFFVDIDGSPEHGAKQASWDRLMGAALPPSMVVDSRNGLHAYWLAEEGEDPAHYREIEEGLIRAFSGDERAKDLARVLRAPGFDHRKEAPYPVRVLDAEAVRYAGAELAAEYPAPAPARPAYAPVSTPATEPPSSARLLALLDHCAAQWRPGQRHEAAMAMSGKLWWWGVPQHDAEALMRRVCELAGDPDPEDRMAALRSTYRRGERGEGVTTGDLRGLKF